MNTINVVSLADDKNLIPADYTGFVRTLEVLIEFKNGKIHSDNGPAIVHHKYTTKQWFKGGLRHRVGGPAIELADGGFEWWENDKLHRTDGPAVKYTSGTEEWRFEGAFHRLDGPAVVWLGMAKFSVWYLFGKNFSREKHSELVQKMLPLQTTNPELTLRQCFDLVQQTQS